MKNSKKTLGFLSILTGVIWVFYNESEPGTAGALIGIGIVISFPRTK